MVSPGTEDTEGVGRSKFSRNGFFLALQQLPEPSADAFVSISYSLVTVRGKVRLGQHDTTRHDMHCSVPAARYTGDYNSSRSMITSFTRSPLTMPPNTTISVLIVTAVCP